MDFTGSLKSLWRIREIVFAEIGNFAPGCNKANRTRFSKGALSNTFGKLQSNLTNGISEIGYFALGPSRRISARFSTGPTLRIHLRNYTVI